MAGVIDRAKAAIRREASEGVKPMVMLALAFALLALYRTRGRR